MIQPNTFCVHTNPELFNPWVVLLDSGLGCIFIIMLAAWITKKYIRTIPKEWLPLLNIISGIILMFIHTPILYSIGGWGVNLISGTVFGLAATGIYETYKQIIRRKRKRAYIKGKSKHEQLNF